MRLLERLSASTALLAVLNAAPAWSNETCGGAPCALAGDLLVEARNPKVHVIGLKERGVFFGWDSQGHGGYINGTTVARCQTDRTGGLYVSSETEDELAEALKRTLGCQFLTDAGRRHTG